MSEFNRIITIVLDSVGIGQAPDADKFGDEGADTLGHIGATIKEELVLHNLVKLGLGNIRDDNPMMNIPVSDNPIACYGKMCELSAGKDSMDGHWEMMGDPVQKKMDIFPNGFPLEIINKIEKFSNRKVIVNRPYSGTEIIHDFGEKQLREGCLIVYTSGDSVLQIAAHEHVISVEELYRICRFVRTLFDDSNYNLGRVIARPYVGENADDFERTSNRKDFTMTPKNDTVLDILKTNGVETTGIGKIVDIFSGRGIENEFHTVSNEDGMQQTINQVKQSRAGFIFTNLVDFDAKYGHRRDPEGYGKALMRTDKQLGQLIQLMTPNDLLIITADHGNDPTFKGTDHTREFVPLIAFSPKMRVASLGIRKTFSDIGKTILDNFGIVNSLRGQSFLNQIK